MDKGVNQTASKLPYSGFPHRCSATDKLKKAFISSGSMWTQKTDMTRQVQL